MIPISRQELWVLVQHSEYGRTDSLAVLQKLISESVLQKAYLEAHVLVSESVL
jgi:hypothetical protein